MVVIACEAWGGIQVKPRAGSGDEGLQLLLAVVIPSEGFTKNRPTTNEDLSMDNCHYK